MECLPKERFGKDFRLFLNSLRDDCALFMSHKLVAIGFISNQPERSFDAAPMPCSNMIAIDENKQELSSGTSCSRVYIRLNIR